MYIWPCSTVSCAGLCLEDLSVSSPGRVELLQFERLGIFGRTIVVMPRNGPLPRLDSIKRLPQPSHSKSGLAVDTLTDLAPGLCLYLEASSTTSKSHHHSLRRYRAVFFFTLSSASKALYFEKLKKKLRKSAADALRILLPETGNVV